MMSSFGNLKIAKHYLIRVTGCQKITLLMWKIQSYKMKEMINRNNDQNLNNFYIMLLFINVAVVF